MHEECKNQYLRVQEQIKLLANEIDELKEEFEKRVPKEFENDPMDFSFLTPKQYDEAVKKFFGSYSNKTLLDDELF